MMVSLPLLLTILLNVLFAATEGVLVILSQERRERRVLRPPTPFTNLMAAENWLRLQTQARYRLQDISFVEADPEDLLLLPMDFYRRQMSEEQAGEILHIPGIQEARGRIKEIRMLVKQTLSPPPEREGAIRIGSAPEQHRRGAFADTGPGSRRPARIIFRYDADSPHSDGSSDSEPRRIVGTPLTRAREEGSETAAEGETIFYLETDSD